MGKASDVYVAKESFTTNLDGQEVVISKGVTRVRAGHPLMKGREALFELLEVQYDVEQATSAPGEQRGAPQPARAATPRPRVAAPAGDKDEDDKKDE